MVKNNPQSLFEISPLKIKTKTSFSAKTFRLRLQNAQVSSGYLDSHSSTFTFFAHNLNILSRHEISNKLLKIRILNMNCIKIPSEDFIFIREKIESMANKYIFNPMGMTLSSMRVLSYINCQDKINAKEIIELTGKSKSNITQRLNVLEKNGLIRRLKNDRAKDKREVYLKITPQGKRKVAEALRKIEKFHLSKTHFFTKKELENHIKFMRKLSLFLDKEEEKLKEIFN